MYSMSKQRNILAKQQKKNNAMMIHFNIDCYKKNSFQDEFKKMQKSVLIIYLFLELNPLYKIF